MRTSAVRLCSLVENYQGWLVSAARECHYGERTGTVCTAQTREAATMRKDVSMVILRHSGTVTEIEASYSIPVFNL